MGHFKPLFEAVGVYRKIGFSLKSNHQINLGLSTSLIRSLVFATVYIKDLDKLNLVKLVNGGLVLGSSHFLLLPHMPKKMKIASKLDSKIIKVFCSTKFVTHYATECVTDLDS